MATYKVTMNLDHGEAVLTLKGNNIQEVEEEVKNTYGKSGLMSYSIQQDKPQLTQDHLAPLMNASLGLIGCLCLLIIAEVKIRKWLKG